MGCLPLEEEGRLESMETGIWNQPSLVATTGSQLCNFRPGVCSLLSVSRTPVFIVWVQFPGLD